MNQNIEQYINYPCSYLISHTDWYDICGKWEESDNISTIQYWHFYFEMIMP
jgi:hypothetical protein